MRVIVLEDRDELISKSDPALAAQQERKVFPLKIIVNPTLEVLLLIFINHNINEVNIIEVYWREESIICGGMPFSEWISIRS